MNLTATANPTTLRLDLAGCLLAGEVNTIVFTMRGGDGFDSETLYRLVAKLPRAYSGAPLAMDDVPVVGTGDSPTLTAVLDLTTSGVFDYLGNNQGARLALELHDDTAGVLVARASAHLDNVYTRPTDTAPAVSPAHTYTDAQVRSLIGAGGGGTGGITEIESDTEPKLGGDLDGQDHTVSQVNLQDYGEVVNALGSVSGAVIVSLALGNVITATIAGAATFSFTNPTATGKACSWELILVNAGAHAVTWPGSVKWDAAVPPVLSTSGRSRLAFETLDGGTTIDGALIGKDYA